MKPRLEFTVACGPEDNLKGKIKPQPITTFRASCEGKSLYYKVFVWRTVGDLRRAVEDRTALGMCRSFRVLRVAAKGSGMRDYMKPILGEIHLAATRLTTGIVTHECCHAMMSWAAERKCIPLFTTAMEREAATKSRNGALSRNDPEERCCFVLGNLVRQIVLTLYKKGVLK